MILETLIPWAHAQSASDLHLEPGLPAAVRVRGVLKTVGEPLPPQALWEAAQDIIGADDWPRFAERRSFDMSKTVKGVRCRFNILHTSRGVGFAIRLLTTFEVSLEKLNLHPDLRRLMAGSNGLVIVTGTTGSGKSTTMAALIEEINRTESRHVVTVESPIEFTFKPKRCYIRQREVGRDTPSFEQALLDALREDPDVLMVGEMRDPETMRLTLNASETGHLVLVTMHSASCAEALARMAASFPPESQGAVRAQLADTLTGVVAQRLRYRQDLNLRVPECEILMPTNPVRHMIRTGEFFKLAQFLETGADAGMWTFARYQKWMASRTQWHVPSVEPEPEMATEPGPTPKSALLHPEPHQAPRYVPPAPSAKETHHAKPAQTGAPIEIVPVEGGLDALVKKLAGDGKKPN